MRRSVSNLRNTLRMSMLLVRSDCLTQFVFSNSSRKPDFTRPAPVNFMVLSRKFHRRKLLHSIRAAPLCRGEALFLLDCGELPRGIWYVRLQRHAFQSRITPKRRRRLLPVKSTSTGKHQPVLGLPIYRQHQCKT